MKILILFIAYCLLFVGCTKDMNPVSPDIPEDPSTRPGRFGIQLANGLQKINAIKIGDTLEFYLGELYGSKNYYFILTNTGDTPITNVRILAQDSTIEISPDSLYRLNPTSTASSVLPIIKTTALHGLLLEGGSGYTPLQALGPQTKQLQITGESDTALTVYVKLRYYVYSMAFELRRLSQIYNLATESYGDVFGFPTYLCGRDTSPVYIKNIGNVELTVNQGYNALQLDSLFHIPAGDSLVLRRPQQNMLFLKVSNQKNAVADGAKYWEIRRDGSINLMPLWDQN